MFRNTIVMGMIIFLSFVCPLHTQTVIKDDFRVNDDYHVGGSNQRNPAIAMAHNGNFVVIWTDERNMDIDIFGQRFDRFGNPLGENFKVNNTPLSAKYIQYNHSLAMDAGGNFVVVWSDYRDKTFYIYAQRYSSTASPIGSNFKVNDDQLKPIADFYPVVSMNPSGEFVVIWISIEEDFYIYGQRYSSSGEKTGNNFKIVKL